MRAIAPQGKLSPARVGDWVKVRVSFRVGGGGGNQAIAPEENSPRVRVRVWLRVSFRVGAGGGGAIFLGDNCPRTEKQLCRSLIYNEGAGCMDKSNFLASHFTRRRCFPVKFAKFLRTPFENTNNSVEHLRSCKVLFVNC